MTEIRGHSYRFKVIDGVNAVATEISSPDYHSMKEWTNTLKMVAACVNPSSLALSVLPKKGKCARLSPSLVGREPRNVARFSPDGENFSVDL